MTKPTKWHVRPAKTQISLGIRPVLDFFKRTAKTLIRLGGCPGWSESSLGAHAILLVLSRCGSFATDRSNMCKLTTAEFNANKSRECNPIPRNNPKFEPRHDKTNKMSVRQAKTQISLGIRPVWSESSLSAWKKVWVLSYPLSAQRGGCPGWSESSLGTHSFWWFCHIAAHLCLASHKRNMANNVERDVWSVCLQEFLLKLK